MSTRWNDRFMSYERDRASERESERGSERGTERDRTEDQYYRERERERRPPSPPRFRDHPDDRLPAPAPPPAPASGLPPGPRGRTHDDDYVARGHERERHYFEDDRFSTPQPQPRFQQPPKRDADYERRDYLLEREREYESRNRNDPLRRPQAARRTSSFDAFDRRPLPPRFYEREEYGPPARREDYRPAPTPPPAQAPLPRTRQLPPPERRTYNDLPYYDEIAVAEPDRYGDEEFHAYPDRVREREVVRSSRRRDRDRSRDSYTTATTATTMTRGRRRRSESRSRSSMTSSRSSSSSSSSRSTAVRSEYPKKGKTKIPARLVSIRAIIDLGYPFIEQGNTIIVQKALGQDNIDELLKLSEEYKKGELQISNARSSAGDLLDDRRREVYAVPVPAALPAPPPPPPEVFSPIPSDKFRTPAPPPPPQPAPAFTPAPPTPAPPTVIPAPPPPAPPAYRPAQPAYAPAQSAYPPAQPAYPPAQSAYTGAPSTHPNAPLVVDVSPPPPPPAPTTVFREHEEYSSYHGSNHPHHQHHHSASPVVYRDVSPTRTSLTSTSMSTSSYSPSFSSPRHAHFTSPTSGPVVVARDYDYEHYDTSNDIPVGTMALAPRHRAQSASRSGREIRAEIRALEARLHDRKRGIGSSELVKAERLPDGGLVLYEEKVEKVEQGYKGARIERDKKGPPPGLMRAMLATLT